MTSMILWTSFYQRQLKKANNRASLQKCAVLEQSTWRGIFEPSTSHGGALNEATPNLVHHPLRRGDD